MFPAAATYDVDFRFRRALNPDGLSTVETCTSAIAEAINDARNAGGDPEQDAGVLLLSRHLGLIAGGRNPEHRDPVDDALRERCYARLAALLHQPTIVVLARRGLGDDPLARRRFANEARSVLSALGCALGLTESEMTISRSPISRDGLELRSRTVGVLIDGSAPSGTEVSVTDGIAATSRGRPRHFVHDIGVLLDVPRFARAIRRELRLRDTSQPRQSALI